MNILAFLPAIVVIFGTVLLIKLKFFFILHPGRTLKTLKTSLSHKGAIKSLMLSLAGTLGVGNIVGVAFGISVGGAGSVFWLLISSLFSMILKFSESSIASDMREGELGGMMYVIKQSFPKAFKFLAYSYAILCLFLSLSMGSALQARAAVESIGSENKNVLIISAFVFTLFVAFAILGGAKKIENITVFIIPFASIIYIFLTLSVIFLHFDRLPEVISEIFASAFDLKAGVGGVGAFLISTNIREGFCRGLLSNEAGAGTSSMAHSRNPDNSPVSVGLVGMCEVFADTVILCILTALAVLCAVPSPNSYSSGMEIVSLALGTLGKFARPLLSFSIIAFAYSTVICWYYYGEVCLSFITKKGKLFFPVLFLFCVFFGSLTPSDFLIKVSDYLLFFLTVISLIAVMKNSDRLVFLSEKYGLITKLGCGIRKIRQAKKEP